MTKKEEDKIRIVFITLWLSLQPVNQGGMGRKGVKTVKTFFNIWREKKSLKADDLIQIALKAQKEVLDE